MGKSFSLPKPPRAYTKWIQSEPFEQSKTAKKAKSEKKN